jgi:hypothetical protein
LIEFKQSKIKPGAVIISGKKYQDSAPGVPCEFSAFSKILAGAALGGEYHAQRRQTTGGG